MAALDSLEVENVVADRIAGPFGVRQIGQDVILADEHGDGNLIDCFDGDQISGAVLTNTKEGVVLGSPNLEALLPEVLGIVQETSGGRTVGLVVDVDLEAVGVVVLGVAACEERFKKFAEP